MTSLSELFITTPTMPISSTVDIMKAIPSVRWLVFTCYLLVCIAGLLGNSMVLFVVCRSRAMRTVTNMFIANLALSDIVMGLIATPFTPLAFYMEEWQLPNFLCRCLPLTMGMSVFVSTWTSSAIAIERLRHLSHPFVRRMTLRQCLLAILLIWMAAIIMSTPLALNQVLVDKRSSTQGNSNANHNYSSSSSSGHPVLPLSHKPPVLECTESWASETQKALFVAVSLLLQFIAPTVVISFCYLRISRVLRRRYRRRAQLASQRQRDRIVDIHRKRRTNRMLIAMVTVFIACWIPLNTLHPLLDFTAHQDTNQVKRSSSYENAVFFLCHWVAMSSAVYNPVIYAWMNEAFRSEFKKSFQCCFQLSELNNDIPQNGEDMAVLSNIIEKHGSAVVRQGVVNSRDEHVEPSPTQGNGDTSNNDTTNNGLS